MTASESMAIRTISRVEKVANLTGVIVPFAGSLAAIVLDASQALARKPAARSRSR